MNPLENSNSVENEYMKPSNNNKPPIKKLIKLWNIIFIIKPIVLQKIEHSIK